MIRLFYIPSFCAAVLWWFWFGVYLLGPLGWDVPSAESVETFICVGLLFTAQSMFSFLKSDPSVPRVATPSLRSVIALSALGIFGILHHLYTLSGAFHGFGNLLSTFATHSFEVRWENAEVTSVGVQLSYVGWLAAGLASILIANSGGSRSEKVVAGSAWICVLVFNFLMIDRTRPFWIITTTVFVVMSIQSKLQLGRAIAGGAATCLALVGIFVSIALWSGKIGDHTPGSSTLSAAAFNLSIYGTGGFAYFDKISYYYENASFLPERSLYPLFKIASSLGITGSPPAQILDFESIPHEVNVGTVLTPLYLDGGWLYLFIVFPLIVALVDGLALSFLRSTSPIQRCAWAALCYGQLLAFFSSPLFGTPCWCFVLAGLCSKVVSRRDRPEATSFGLAPLSSERIGIGGPAGA